MYKTDPYSTVYASYVQSLEQGGAASNTQRQFPAYVRPAQEQAVRSRLQDGPQKWGANLALFRIDQGYNYTNTSNVFVQDGTKRYTGVDASGWVAARRANGACWAA